MDIALSQTGLGLGFDIEYRIGDFASDAGLETAVAISLFTDRRVTDDELPLGETDRRGWWGDMFPDLDGDQIGSKLWLLEREKITDDTLNRAQEYAEEALAWLIEDGVAESVTVEASVGSSDRLDLAVSITRPKNENVALFRYQLNWDAQAERR